MSGGVCFQSRMPFKLTPAIFALVRVDGGEKEGRPGPGVVRPAGIVNGLEGWPSDG